MAEPTIGYRELGVGACGMPEAGNKKGIRAGFKTKGIAGEEKDFYHWRNAVLDSRWNVEKLKRLCAVFLLHWDMEVQIGPAIDVPCLLYSGKIIIMEAPRWRPMCGLYVEREKLGMLQLIKFPESLQSLPIPKYLQRLPKNLLGDPILVSPATS